MPLRFGYMRAGWTGLVLLYIATFFSLISAAEYFISFFRQGGGQVKAAD